MDALNKFEARLTNERNYFFVNNKLLPYVKVTAYRVKPVPCTTSGTAPLEGEEEAEECWSDNLE